MSNTTGIPKYWLEDSRLYGVISIVFKKLVYFIFGCHFQGLNIDCASMACTHDKCQPPNHSESLRAIAAVKQDVPMSLATGKAQERPLLCSPDDWRTLWLCCVEWYTPHSLPKMRWFRYILRIFYCKALPLELQFCWKACIAWDNTLLAVDCAAPRPPEALVL